MIRIDVDKRFIGVDLFAGAGGMSLGAELAGIDVRLAVEIDPYAAATYKHNHHDTHIIIWDVSDLKEIPVSKKGKVSGLFGFLHARGKPHLINELGLSLCGLIT